MTSDDATRTHAPVQPDDSRVTRAVEEYLALLEAGAAPDRRAFLARHPEVADALAACLEGLDFVRSAAPALSGPGREPEPGTANPSAPILLGEYRILRQVGRGGMGVVYEAEQLSLRRRVALKVLPFAAVVDPRHLQRFKYEAVAAAGLDHPNVVKVYGVGCERGVHFIAMQFIDGRSLAELIRDRRDSATAAAPRSDELTRSLAPDATSPSAPPAPATAAGSRPRTPADAAYFRRVAEWGAQAAEGLEHAHALGVVHRDVKPGNLLVDAAGKLWVADFGLAKVATDPGVTGTGDILGTVRYMSPEQAAAKHDLVDHRSDVYSLGATLYELLTLTPVVDGADAQQALSRVLSAEPVAPRRLERRLPADLETVVLKCLEKDPGRRYQSAADLAADLRRFLNGEPVRAKRPTALDRVTKWARRHRGAVWAGVSLLALSAALSATAAAVVWREKGAKEKALDEKTQALAAKEQALADKTSALAEKEAALGQRDAALAEKSNALRRADRHLRGALDAGRNLLGLGAQLSQTGGDRADEAMVAGARVFEAVAADYPDRLSAREDLAEVCQSTGDALAQKGKFDRALPLYRKLAEVWLGVRADFPDYDRSKGAYPLTAAQIAMSHGRLASCLAELGRLAEADAAYRTALAAWDEVAAKANPAVSEFHDGERALELARLGTVAAQRGRVAEAEEAYTKAIDLATRRSVLAPAPILRLARIGRAELFWSAGRVAEAEAAFREALAGADGRTQAWLLATGPLPGLRDAQKALALVKGVGPNADAATWRIVAAVHARAGNRKEAEDAVAKAGGGRAPELFLLAALCQKQDDGKAAAQWYGRGVQWMTSHNPHDLESRRLRDEAAETLGIVAPPPRPKGSPG